MNAEKRGPSTFFERIYSRRPYQKLAVLHSHGDAGKWYMPTTKQKPLMTFRRFSEMPLLTSMVIIFVGGKVQKIECVVSHAKFTNLNVANIYPPELSKSISFIHSFVVSMAINESRINKREIIDFYLEQHLVFLQFLKTHIVLVQLIGKTYKTQCRYEYN